MKKSSLFLATALVGALGAGSVLAQATSSPSPSTTPPPASSSSTPSGTAGSTAQNSGSSTSGTNASSPNATSSSSTAGRSSTSSSTSASSASSSGTQFWTQDTSNDWRTSKLKGLNVYNNNNEKLGDIDDILVDQSGQIKAVIIGVGGFLGMGEHLVAVPFNQLQFVNNPDRTAALNNTVVAGDTIPVNPARPNPATPSTTTPGNTGLGSPPGTTVPAGSTAASNDIRRDRWAPDRAVLNATKDQLKSAPEFKYRG